jgi:hypothetical protein
MESSDRSLSNLDIFRGHHAHLPSTHVASRGNTLLKDGISLASLDISARAFPLLFYYLKPRVGLAVATRYQDARQMALSGTSVVRLQLLLQPSNVAGRSKGGEGLSVRNETLRKGSRNGTMKRMDPEVSGRGDIHSSVLGLYFVWRRSPSADGLVLRAGQKLPPVKLRALLGQVRVAARRPSPSRQCLLPNP